jgi:hypothetical protein
MLRRTSLIRERIFSPFLIELGSIIGERQEKKQGKPLKYELARLHLKFNIRAEPVASPVKEKVNSG